MEELYNTAPVGLWRTEIESGKFIHANKTALEILGFESFEELSSVVAGDLYDPTLRVEFIEELKQIKEVTDFEVLIRRKDGKKVWVTLSAKIHPEQGFLEGTMQTCHKKLEVAIRPHLEKISLIKKNIIQKLEQPEYCHSILKTA